MRGAYLQLHAGEKTRGWRDATQQRRNVLTHNEIVLFHRSLEAVRLFRVSPRSKHVPYLGHRSTWCSKEFVKNSFSHFASVNFFQLRETDLRFLFVFQFEKRKHCTNCNRIRNWTLVIDLLFLCLSNFSFLSEFKTRRRARKRFFALNIKKYVAEN